MALSAKLEMRQGQQLVMTPQLQQAIRLLQYSNLQLSEFIDQEIERNPLLERDEATDAPLDLPERSTDAPEMVESRPEGDAAEDAWLDLAKPAADPVAALDTDIENVCPVQRPPTTPRAIPVFRAARGPTCARQDRAFRTTSSISKRLSPPKFRSRIISHSSCRWHFQTMSIC